MLQTASCQSSVLEKGKRIRAAQLLASSHLKLRDPSVLWLDRVIHLDGIFHFSDF